MAPVLPSQAAVPEVIVCWNASKHGCGACRSKWAHQYVGLHCVSLSVPAQLRNLHDLLHDSTAFCGTDTCVLRRKAGYSSQICMGKDWKITHGRTKLWLSKTKHQSFLQEHQKVFITDFHRMFSANRTFGRGKIESFCIKQSVVTTTVISESSPSNEMLKEKLMAQAKNDKEKKHLGRRCPLLCTESG